MADTLPMCASTLTTMFISMNAQLVRQWLLKNHGMNVVAAPTAISSHGWRYCVTQLNGLWNSWCIACIHLYKNLTCKSRNCHWLRRAVLTRLTTLMTSIHLMEGRMKGPVVEVKNDKAGGQLPNELPQGRSDWIQWHRRLPYPLSSGSG